MHQSSIKIIFPFVDSDKWINNQMVSRRVNNKNLIEGLSTYFICEECSIDRIFQKENENDDYDYIFVDFTDTKLLLFIFREQGLINKPFLIKLPVVFGEIILIIKMIPFLKNEDLIFAPSAFARNSFYKISKNNNVHVIPNSIDVKKIQENIVIDAEKNNLTLGFIGRVVPEKGIKTIIECLPILVKSIPGIRLEVVGPFNGNLDIPGKSDFFLELEELSKKLKIDHLIIWHGCLNGLKKYEVLSKWDIMIHPSVFKGETFGVSNIDALSCGVPVICSNWAGFSEIITHGQNGYLVDVDYNDNNYKVNEEQLVKYILGLLKDNEKLFAFKKAAKESSYRFDHKNVHQITTELLVKGVTTKGNWQSIKDNNLSDYKEFYTKNFFEIMHKYGIANIKLKQIIENLEIECNDVLYNSFINLIKSYKFENKKELVRLFSESDFYNMIYLNEFLKEDVFLTKIKEEERQHFFQYITSS